MSSTLARGTVPTTSPVNGLCTSSVRALPTRSPAMRMDSVSGLRAGARWAAVSIARTSGVALAKGFSSGEMVEAEVERVEVAPAALWQVGRRPVRDQRHALLGDAAMRAQRRVEARQVVAALAAADDGEPLRDDDEI